MRQSGVEKHPSIAVSNPASQKVTSSAAFSSDAGNNNNENVYDGTGNAGVDTYRKWSKLQSARGVTRRISDWSQLKQIATMVAGIASLLFLNGLSSMPCGTTRRMRWQSPVPTSV